MTPVLRSPQPHRRRGSSDALPCPSRAKQQGALRATSVLQGRPCRLFKTRPKGKKRQRGSARPSPGRSWQRGEEGSTVTLRGPRATGAAPGPGAGPGSRSHCIPLRPGTLLPDRPAGDSRGSRNPATGGCPSQAFWAQIAVAALAGDLGKNPDVTGHGDALRRAPGMLQGLAIPSEDTGARLPLLSWQYISPAPNPLCELSPRGETHPRLAGGIFPWFFLFFKANLKLFLPFPGVSAR